MKACKRNFTIVKFGERLSTLIRDSERSKGDLARGIGISPGAISNYINEDRVPEAQILHDMAEYFGVSMEFLLTGEERGRKDPTVGSLEGVALHEREISQKEWDVLCVEHLRRWLDHRVGEPEMHAWALVELRRQFPMERRKEEAAPASGRPAQPIHGLNSELSEKARSGGHAAASKVLSEHATPEPKRKLPTHDSSAGKP